MRQKRNRKPALGLEVGCGFGRSSLMKKTVNLRDSSKLDPLSFSVFFVCFANPDGAAVRTAARLCGSGGALRRGEAGDQWSPLRNRTTHGSPVNRRGDHRSPDLLHRGGRWGARRYIVTLRHTFPSAHFRPLGGRPMVAPTEWDNAWFSGKL